MSEYFDVIIIGAGPAGLNCANHLQNTGKKVLILEKHKVIGPKVCAGGLTQKDFDYLKLPKNIIGHSFNKIIYQTRLQRTTITKPGPFIYTVDRKALGQWQLSKLKFDNIIIQTEQEVIKINNNHIITRLGDKLYFKYLVGADGSASLVRRYLKIKSEIIGLGIHYVIPTKNFNDFELHYNHKYFNAWYGWIFPHNHFISIGTGGDPRKVSAKTMHSNLKKWMNDKGIDYSAGHFEAFPINNDYRGYQFKNVFLIGDAAGLASEFNGEGIYQALISGEEIAHIILNHQHQTTKLDQILAAKARHAKVLHILEKSGIFRPVLLELIALGFHSRYLTDKAFKYVLN